MLVEELIERLKTLPPKSEVVKESCDGCSDCNPEGFNFYSTIYTVEYREQGDYPNTDAVRVVVL